MSWDDSVVDWEYWLKKYIELVGTNVNFWRGRYYEELFRKTFLEDTPRWNIEFVTLTAPILHFHEIQSCYETDKIPINKSKMTLLVRLNQQKDFKSWLHIYDTIKERWITTTIENLLDKEVDEDEVIRTAKFGEGKTRRRYLIPFDFFKPTDPKSQGWKYEI